MLVEIVEPAGEFAKLANTIYVTCSIPERIKESEFLYNILPLYSELSL